MNPAVARATMADLDTLVTLFDGYRCFYGQVSDRLSARRFLTERIESEDSAVFLATDHQSDRGLGFAQLFPSFSSVAMKRIWILNDVFVEATVRRQGIGNLLMAAVHDFAEASGASRIDLATGKSNSGAKSLYESFGYHVDTAFDHYKLAIDG